MNADRKMNLIAGALGVLVIGGIATGVGTYAVNANQTPTVQSTPTPTVEADPASFPVYTSGDRVVDQATSDALEAQRAAEAEAARVAAEQAAAQAEADRIAAEQAAAEQAAREQQRETQSTNNSGGGSSNPAPPAAPAPIRCPSGSQAVSGDGGNDTACLPEICFRIVLPDAAHPECEAPFRP